MSRFDNQNEERMCLSLHGQTEAQAKVETLIFGTKKLKP